MPIKTTGHLAFPHGDNYGFVWWHEARLELYTFHGFTMPADVPADGRAIIVETWFGRGAADFRVVSLHSFSAEVLTERPQEIPLVRFGFAGENDTNDVRPYVLSAIIGPHDVNAPPSQGQHRPSHDRSSSK